jgi:hypothetical protein
VHETQWGEAGGWGVWVSVRCLRYSEGQWQVLEAADRTGGNQKLCHISGALP